MVTYKLVFCDFDDTLVASGRAVGERTRRAIADYREAGGTFVICTGRSRVSLEKRLAAVYGSAKGIPYICFQGGTIVDENGNELRHLTVSRDDIVRVSDEAVRAGYECAFHVGGEVYSERKTPVTENYAELTGCPIIYDESGRSIARTFDGKFDKMMILATLENRKYMEKLTGIPVTGSRFMFSGPTYLELVPSESGKGGAVKFMTARMGFDRSDVAAFGDADNDVDMLAEAGLPVAIRGGMPRCLAAARIIAAPASEEGVADVLRMFIV